MPTDFEEEYLDVLQNIEFSLASVYHKHAALTDWDTLKAVEALIRTYQAEASQRPAPPLRLSGLAEEVFASAQAMCEVRLGRQSLTNEQGQNVGFAPEAVTVPEIVACLKRIKRSIEKWQKEGGRRGYYEFVRQFLGM